MLVPRQFIQFVGKELVKRLAKGACSIKSPDLVETAFDEIILEAVALEEEINAEARELLNQYSDFMRKNQIPYHEMFSKVKRQILQERGVVSAQARGSSGKISREKVTELSHQLAAKLPRLSGVRVLKGWNEVRLEIAREMMAILQMEEEADERARNMITNQKRDITEGGEEYKALHRRFYEQEMQRLGVDMSTPAVAER